MEGITCIRLPTLPCSFPLSQPHPLYPRLVEEIDAFCRSFATGKALDFIAAENWPLLACVSWPTALESRLPWVAKFLCWFILLDTDADNMDSLGSDGQRTAVLMQKYIQVVSQGQAPSFGEGDAAPQYVGSGAADACAHTLLTSFASLWHHFRCNMTRTQYARLSSRCTTYFTLIAHESQLREEGAVLRPADLLQLKCVVGAGMMLVSLMEYAAGIELDEHILNRPEIQEIQVACVNHFVTVNDILSFRKEYLGRDFHNLPSSFRLSEGVDLQKAVELTAELVHSADRQFCELHAAISRASYLNPQVKAFIDGLGYMMSGALEWSWQTARYHGLGWVVPPGNKRQGIMYLEDPPRFESAS